MQTSRLLDCEQRRAGESASTYKQCAGPLSLRFPHPGCQQFLDTFPRAPRS